MWKCTFWDADAERNCMCWCRCIMFLSKATFSSKITDIINLQLKSFYWTAIKNTAVYNMTHNTLLHQQITQILYLENFKYIFITNSYLDFTFFSSLWSIPPEDEAKTRV